MNVGEGGVVKKKLVKGVRIFFGTIYSGEFGGHGQISGPVAPPFS